MRPSIKTFFRKGLPAAALLLLAIAPSGCAQVHQRTIAFKCVDRPANQLLPGEVQYDTFTFMDVSTNPIPMLFVPHRTVAHCDDKGALRYDLETPIDTGLSQLSTPLSTAASHVTYVP
jgi:hypothetical protein